MDHQPNFQRPSFDDALSAWKALLRERRLPEDCLWVFDENLCFEPDAAAPGGFRLGIQSRFTPPPQDAEKLAYEYFSEFENRIVFYRVGTCLGKSVCLILSDEWFDRKGEPDGYVRRDEWRVSFRPGDATTVEEVADRGRWEKRVVRNRPLHDLDFCMTLRAVHEMLAHGRVLSTYEHYALRFLHLWRRVLGHPE